MSKYLIEDTTLTSIADAIREKGGTTDPILAGSMAAAIAAIETGGSVEPFTSVVCGDFTTSFINKYSITIDGLSNCKMFAAIQTSFNGNAFHENHQIVALIISKTNTWAGYVSSMVWYNTRAMDLEWGGTYLVSLDGDTFTPPSSQPFYGDYAYIMAT